MLLLDKYVLIKERYQGVPQILRAEWKRYKSEHGIQTSFSLFGPLEATPGQICVRDPANARAGIFVLVPEEFAFKVLALGGFP